MFGSRLKDIIFCLKNTKFDYDLTMN
jgi:hypothetical protein